MRTPVPDVLFLLVPGNVPVIAIVLDRCSLMVNRRHLGGSVSPPKVPRWDISRLAAWHKLTLRYHRGHNALHFPMPGGVYPSIAAGPSSPQSADLRVFAPLGGGRLMPVSSASQTST